MAGLILVSGVAFKVEKAALTAIKDIDLDACLFNSSVGADYSDVMVACNNANVEVFMLNIPKGTTIASINIIMNSCQLGCVAHLLCKLDNLGVSKSVSKLHSSKTDTIGRTNDFHF